MNWSVKWDIFMEKISYNGFDNEFVKMLGNGLWITVKIAVLGLIIGIFIGMGRKLYGRDGYGISHLL